MKIRCSAEVGPSAQLGSDGWNTLCILHGFPMSIDKRLQQFLCFQIGGLCSRFLVRPATEAIDHRPCFTPHGRIHISRDENHRAPLQFVQFALTRQREGDDEVSAGREIEHVLGMFVVPQVRLAVFDKDDIVQEMLAANVRGDHVGIINDPSVIFVSYRNVLKVLDVFHYVDYMKK